MDEYGDPEVDLDAAIADSTLREALGELPEPGAGDGPPAGRVEAIEALIESAWPDGTAPTVAELADDPGFADFMAAVGAGYDGGLDVAEVANDSTTDGHHHHDADTSFDWQHADPGFDAGVLPDSAHDDG
jgi:hypothetical protein